MSILVAACSVAATAWLASRITTGAIQQERGDALSTDARVYEALLGYAATHSNWAGVTSTVARLATQTGNRITVTTENRHIIATSTGRPQPLPQAASEVVDPLDVDPVLVPDTSTDRVDPRAVGPFALTDAERGYLDELAQRMLICIGRRDGGGSLTFTPSGRPHVTGPNPTVDSTCELSELDYPTATEATALQQLDSLVGACLSRERRPVVRLNLDLTWTRATPSNPDDDQAVQACIDTARREQLSPYVAPAALLFISAPTATASGGLDLSPQNQARIAGVAALILLLAIAVTALAGMWLVRPLRTLTAAARNMTEIGRAHV